jgi:hypothetical protein
MNLLRQLLTGIDGITHDLARWTWAGSWLGVTCTAIWQCATGHPPTLVELAAAYSAVAAGHAVSIKAKETTEPKP